ncbi:T9SS type A sorting domain-containing protein, partial [Flavobacterium sp. GSN2]
VLATQDFVFSNYFSVYPNPVKDVLNITAKETIEVTSINIYNTLGQLVLVIPNAQNTKNVDVSGLTKGNYFIKINSDKGTANTRFIKN